MNKISNKTRKGIMYGTRNDKDELVKSSINVDCEGFGCSVQKKKKKKKKNPALDERPETRN